MYAARAAKPKISLSISTAQNVSRPALSLKSPGVMPRTPISPASPMARNTWANQRNSATLQTPAYAYTNSSASKSILKKYQTPRSGVSKRIQFNNTPTVYCVTPIDSEDYYGSYVKMSRDERRWGLRA
jgi:N6-L-threonylcarbamoyladenine synthase